MILFVVLDMNKSAPIGIFDSGIGGLTQAYGINKLMPGESIVYFGDTAHLPYGDKSTAAIQAYSIKICNVLLEQKCKVILIACSSASSAAYDLVKEYVGSRAKVFNVIDPVIHYIDASFGGDKVGLIGTKRTVASNTYKTKIDALGKGFEVASLATPLLAPMIEEGFFDNKISQQVISEYLSDKELKDIQALILGCTHYPLIKNEIKAYYQNDVEVIDSSDLVAKEIYEHLKSANLLNDESVKHHFYVSDYTNSFERSTKLFFKEEVKLELYKLWE